MVFALPGPRTLRWLGVDLWTPVDAYNAALTEDGEEFEGGICYYPTNG